MFGFPARRPPKLGYAKLPQCAAKLGGLTSTAVGRLLRPGTPVLEHCMAVCVQPEGYPAPLMMP